MSNAFKHDFSERLTGAVSRASRFRFNAPKLPRPRLPSPKWYPVIGALAGFFFILLFIGGAGQDATARMTMVHEEWLEAETNPVLAAASRMRIERLRSGDNAVSALERLGFSKSDSHSIIHAANSSYKLKNIRAGQSFKRIDSAEGIEIRYNINGEQRLKVHQAAGQKQWQASVEKRPVFTRQRTAEGRIEGSLFAAAERAGMDQRTTMNLVDIFAWDIDFARDMREGDTFRVLYEERFDDEGHMLESSILAAEFVNQGEKYSAVRYEQANGKVDYYTPEGKSMRKAYLRAPVKFSRISSRFRLKRKHPVLGYTRAHRGVDYAAPSGTPIHAIGDGYIASIGWKGGYGRFILIRHNNRQHSTAYAHMRRYARGIKKGKRVRQGQVIGYVGMSGLATGPHLHFEFRSRGRAVNPLTVKHPPAKPVAKTERDRFFQQTAPLLGQLEQQPVKLAWG